MGKWCTMSVGHMGSGESRVARPHHLCVACKDRLGWVAPASIDPREVQKLRLGAIERDAAQAFQFRIGDDQYLLENRQRHGFDAEIEGTGLLIWNLGRGGRIDLIESHGRKAPDASLLETEEIPYPSFYNRHFTPATVPAAPAGVYLTDIVEEQGAIGFTIGVEKDAKSRAIEKKPNY